MCYSEIRTAMKKIYLLLLGFSLMALPGQSQVMSFSKNFTDSIPDNPIPADSIPFNPIPTDPIPIDTISADTIPGEVTPPIENADIINYASRFQNIPQGALGMPTYLTRGTRLQQYKQLYAQAIAGANPEVIAQLKEMNRLVEHGGTSDVTTDMLNGKYFRLYAATDSTSLSVTPEGKLTVVAADDLEQSLVRMRSTDINQLWQIHTTDDGNLTILHANRDAYVQAADSLSATSTSFTLKSLGDAQFAFTTADGKLLTATSGNVDNNTVWYLLPIESIRLRLDDLGSEPDIMYASTYLPFGISHVEGAQAYVGSEPVKGCMNLTAVDDFARATGVVLISEKGNLFATLTIGGESANNSSVISGTFTQQLIADSMANHYLILDMKVLYHPSYRWVPAFVKPLNKRMAANTAYFYSETGSAVYFEEIAEGADIPNEGSDGFPISGIIEVEKNTSNAQPYYDLSGRRVVHPIKGGVYIQGGKKIAVR